MNMVQTFQSRSWRWPLFGNTADKATLLVSTKEGGGTLKIFKFKKHILKEGFIVIIVMKSSAY